MKGTITIEKYGTYKDSGVEWLGKIPEHWNVITFKFLAKIQNGLDYKKVESFDGGYPVYGSGGVFRSANTFLYNKPSVLLGRKGTIDKPLYVDEPFWTVDTMFYTLILDRVYSKFFYYSCLQIPFNLFKSGSAIPSMTQKELEGVKLCSPSLPEQTAIARFLDRKTALIDRAISQKEQLIELLRERRQILIHQAVTRGLDKDVEMKDSGVEWIGEIPRGWEVKKLKFILKSQGRIGFKGYTTSDLVAEGDGALTLGATHITWDGDVDLSKPVFISWRKYYESPEIMVSKNDVLIVQRGSTCGKVALVRKDYGSVTINPSLVLLKEITENSEFVFLGIKGALSSILNLVSSTAIPMLSQFQINNIQIPLPKVKEQNQILHFINNETKRIDLAMEKKIVEIATLKEYKTTLINAAVTGQLKIPL